MAKSRPKPRQAPPVQSVQPRKNVPVKKAADPAWMTFIKDNWIPMLLISMYLVVDFLPPFDSVDAMGAQWLYLILVGALTVVTILWVKNENFQNGIHRALKSVMSIMYLSLFALAGLSIITALNPTEAFVVYGRMIATVVAYVNIAILLYNRPELVKFFCHILALMLFFRSINILIDLSKGFGEIPLENLIYSQGKETGNKNIMAATFTVRLPFVLYCIYTSRPLGKVFYGIVLTMVILVIFFLNARTTYVAVLLQTFLYLVFCGLLFMKEKGPAIMDRVKAGLLRISYLVIPLMIAFVISQMVLNTAVEMEGREVAYGTVTSRLATITPTGETSNNRVNFWSYALDYTSKHPLIGCGIGNWKLASIPYERDIAYELWVAYHCHNDFLEIMAELGIIGGLLFAGIFFCALFYTIKTWMSEVAFNIKLLSVISLLALAGYFTDAFFNFPNERPVMQFYFVLILGINLTMYLYSRPKKEENAKGITGKAVYGLLALAALIFGFYATYMTYKSMVIQSRTNPDISLEVPKYNSDEAKKLPPIPNLNVFAYPIDAIKARYLLNEKKFDEALFYLNKSIGVNPKLSYNEFMKAATFIEKKQMDSAYIFSKKAFSLRPGAKSNYLMVNYVAMRMGDTAMVRYALIEHHKRKKGVTVYENYLKTMMSLPRNSALVLADADTALKLYPNDSAILMPLRNNLAAMANQMPASNNNAQLINIQDAVKESDAGIAAFRNKDFKGAINHFQKAYNLNNQDYISLENEGMAYYSLSDFKTANALFTRVIASGVIATGKSEFFKGICQINLGNKIDGCKYINISLSKNYPDAAKFADMYCKPSPPK